MPYRITGEGYILKPDTLSQKVISLQNWKYRFLFIICAMDNAARFSEWKRERLQLIICAMEKAPRICEYGVRWCY